MITQLELAEETGKSLRTIKREMNDLKEKGYIRRLNGKRNGKWEILIDIPEKQKRGGQKFQKAKNYKKERKRKLLSKNRLKKEEKGGIIKQLKNSCIQ